MLTSAERHIFLYAKYHYQQNSVIEDLKKILSERSNIDAEYITFDDILIVLFSIVFNYIKTEYRFLELFQDIFRRTEIYKQTSREAVIESFLSVLRFIKVKDIPFKLGEADPNILPLKEKE
jgi:hypothetical protein